LMYFIIYLVDRVLSISEFVKLKTGTFTWVLM